MNTSEIETLPGGTMLGGHFTEFRRNPVALLQRGQAQLGSVFRMKLGMSQMFVLASPAANAAFFRADNDQLSGRQLHRYMIPILGNKVAYGVSPEVMDEQMKLLHGALRDEMMQAYADCAVIELNRLQQQLGDRGEFELVSTMTDLTLSILGRCLLGDEFQNRSSEFRHFYADLEAGMNPIAFVAPRLPIPKHRRRDRALVSMTAMIREIRATQSRESDRDALSLLTNCKSPDGSPLSDEVITGLLLLLLFAGHRTSAALASWLGLLLLNHRADLERVLDESAIINIGKHLEIQELRKLKYLECCIKETERLYPPVIYIMRKALREFSADGRRIPSGSVVLVSPAVTHRLPEIFADPNKYDPSRFLPPREEGANVPFSLIGFGGGKHRCLGYSFAFQQIKLIWVTLLRAFELEAAQDGFEPNYLKIGPVTPRIPCIVRFRRRLSNG